MRVVRWAVLSMCLSVIPVFAAPPLEQLGLAWEFTRAYTPVPDTFILTITQAGVAPRQMKVALSAPGACVTFPHGVEDTFCTVMACPAPGTVAAYWMQAQWGTTFSDHSNILTCLFKYEGTKCVCIDPKDIKPLPPPPPPPRLPDPPKNPPALVTTPPLHPTTSPIGLNIATQMPTLPPMTIPPLPTGGASS